MNKEININELKDKSEQIQNQIDEAKLKLGKMLVEDEALWQGSTIPVEQPDGTITYIPPRTTNICQHDATFFLNPDYPAILGAQQYEINERILHAQMLAEQQAQQAQQGQ